MAYGIPRGALARPLDCTLTFPTVNWPWSGDPAREVELEGVASSIGVRPYLTILSGVRSS